ncbi:MAG: RNA-binding cell elongation regulator Jag/EloR [Armatimonadota bacterium]|nr:RNA-binding cell elongation regulator Jag/EloR [Armatimonadota bacterium]MDR7451086.1 RNA-binding cell elongation regulator Jag/EloR [Armatimonadota bacterium]MDR7465893.1 RNA-binding cell elongation regulator Jag/EloR [Armatimonadota bacterium]MDR7493958.1 RNA-binding cell elongation regulator Jag/EloR [Armatimonadota bacterium]MDR7498408.1 RNA-binding cell elongation regulator Jag/EloR [Armatimonadota bacterium]
MRQVEASGRTVEEAVERALTRLGATAEDVTVEVLDPGTRGMLGLGAREARVRATLKESPAAAVQRVAERFIRALGFSATVRVREGADAIHVEFHGRDLGPLIGRRGATLEAVELLLGLIVAKAVDSRLRISVDIEGYWQRRRAWVERMARQAADRAERQRRPVVLPPMSARERRIVHTVLASRGGVTTASSGEGADRRVTVSPLGGLPEDRGDSGRQRGGGEDLPENGNGFPEA